MHLSVATNYKTERKAQRAKWKQDFLNSLKPGVILYDTWGYDQTQVDFYAVLDVRGSKVLIRELHAVTVPGSEGMMCDRVRPSTQLVTDAPAIWKVIRSNRIKINESVSLRVWDSKDDERGTHRSWYA